MDQKPYRCADKNGHAKEEMNFEKSTSVSTDEEGGPISGRDAECISKRRGQDKWVG